MVITVPCGRSMDWGSVTGSWWCLISLGGGAGDGYTGGLFSVIGDW